MKKLLTVFMLIAMLVPVFSVGVSAVQTNQEVTIPKFAAKPTFDGVVSVEEWGEPTVRVVTKGASTVEDNTIGGDEEAGCYNTFFWFLLEGPFDSLSYTAWLRWDEEYFYAAAIVEDPDPFVLPKGGEDIWMGDIFQFIVDLEGPSARMKALKKDFDYRTDEFRGKIFDLPWSHPDVFNTIVGLVGGSDPTVLRCHGMWNIDDTGEALVGINSIAHDDDTCTTTYECAVSWDVIAAETFEYNDRKEHTPVAGDVYGVALAVCCSDADALNAWLQWGHGICSVAYEYTQPEGTRGGSQAMILSGEEFTPAADYAVYFPPETEEVVSTEPPLITLPPITTAGDTEDVGNTPSNPSSRPSGNKTDDEDGLPIALVAGIGAGIVVIAAVVVVIVKKKKK